MAVLPPTMTTHNQGWLAISTEGFAAMNAARPAEHLIKELVQNAMDALAEGQPGWIGLRYGYRHGGFEVECLDNGCGIDRLEDLRVVYLTHKTDSHLKRGRFGRGFKEALCIADQARVESGGQQLEFLLEHGQRVTRLGPAPHSQAGTRVWMRMPWPAETRDQLDAYFKRFLVPEGLVLEVNGVPIRSRAMSHRIKASISTEIYDASSQSWKKPNRATTLHLVPTLPGETARAFGENIARSVPRVGERHFDEDARDLGVQVVNTAQTSGGFRDMLRMYVPSAQEVVRRDEQAKADRAGSDGFSLADARHSDDERRRWLERQGGSERVERCLAFAVWFCQRLVETCPVRQSRVSGQLTLNSQPGVRLFAHWSSSNILTLALDEGCFWQEPLGAEALSVLIHEAAHAMNMHHGLEFRQEVERLAGVAASLMLQRAAEIRERFPELFGEPSRRDGLGAGLRKLVWAA